MTHVTPGQIPIKRKRILLVEDNSVDAALFRVALSRISTHVDLLVLTNVKEAIGLISKDQRVADIILLDLSLEDGTGFEILQALRTSPVNHIVPTVVLSGSNREEDIRLAYAHGANAYIWKPMEMMEWVEMVQSLADYWFKIVRLP